MADAGFTAGPYRSADGDGEVVMERENDEGNVEYKLKLVNASETRLAHLVTQLKYRLEEGGGEAIYEIGVCDDGHAKGLSDAEMERSLATLRAMCDQLEARMTILRTRQITHSGGSVVEVLVRRLAHALKIELRCAILGDVQCGKSTLVGVLSHGMLDNGAGAARAGVLRHVHELESGCTASVSRRVVGFDASGHVIAPIPLADSPEEVIDRAAKLVTLVDLCGSDKYFKTTVSGLTSHVPDYAGIVVSADRGLSRTTLEHDAIARALSVRLFYVITKADRGSDLVARTLDEVQRDLVKPGERCVPMRIVSEDDAARAARALGTGDRVAPVFILSSVSGEGVDLLLRFLNLLPTPVHWEGRAGAPAVFSVDNVFRANGSAASECHGLSPDASGAVRRSRDQRRGRLDSLDFEHEESHSFDGFTVPVDHAAFGGSLDSTTSWLDNEVRNIRTSSSAGSDVILGAPTRTTGYIVTGTLMQGTINISAAPTRAQRAARSSGCKPARDDLAVEALGRDTLNDISPSTACNLSRTREGARMLIGPDSSGTFWPVAIGSIRYKQVDVDHIAAGHIASFHVYPHAQLTPRRGMVIVSADLSPRACRSVDARVELLSVARNIAVGSQLVLHCWALKCAVQLRAVVAGRLAEGEAAVVRFEFFYAPAFVLEGAQIVFWESQSGGNVTDNEATESRAIGVGTVIRVHDLTSSVADDVAAAERESNTPPARRRQRCSDHREMEKGAACDYEGASQVGSRRETPALSEVDLTN